MSSRWWLALPLSLSVLLITACGPSEPTVSDDDVTVADSADASDSADGAGEDSTDGRRDDSTDLPPDAPRPVVKEGAPVKELLAQLDDPRSRDEARDALIAKGKEAVPPLIEKLSHEKPSVRAAAAFALGQIGDPAALEKLRQLEKSEQDDAASSAVKFAIAAIEESAGGS
jgi:hypothetical protein